jgi:hypothetical protein
VLRFLSLIYRRSADLERALNALQITFISAAWIARTPSSHSGTSISVVGQDPAH